MASLPQKYYSQVKNPNPVLTPRESARTLEFCERLMERATGLTSRFDFAIHVVHARSEGLCRHTPPVLCRRAIDALLRELCFHYDPLINHVQCSITRASRALTFLAELGLITYQTEYDPLVGCYVPADIVSTPTLFAALGVSGDAVAIARRDRVE